MKTMSFEIDGQTVTGTAVMKNGTLWAHVNGESFVFESPQKRSSRRGAKAGAAANPGEILAPMPGKVIKIMTSRGQDVAVQDVLVVMEAMKMEYTLKAQGAGRVSQVACAPGDQVALGQLLVKLELA